MCHGGEEEKMGIIRVNKEEKLIHLLPFIDHGRVERGFITAHSFSAQTHLVNEWARMCEQLDEALCISRALVHAVCSCPNQPSVHTVRRKQVAVCEWRFLEHEDNWIHYSKASGPTRLLSSHRQTDLDTNAWTMTDNSWTRWMLIARS